MMQWRRSCRRADILKVLCRYQGRITEEAIQPVFYKNGRIVTAPRVCTERISRKYAEACKMPVQCRAEFVRTDAIDDIEGCFLSGTSINVLPVKSIGDTVLDSAANPVISAIRHEYDKIIEEYIDNHVKLW